MFPDFLRANGEVVLGGTAYHNNFDTRVNADDTRHILETTSQLMPSLKVSAVFVTIHCRLHIYLVLPEGFQCFDPQSCQKGLLAVTIIWQLGARMSKTYNRF